MQLKLLVVGETKEKTMQELINDYALRINYRLPFKIEVIPDAPHRLTGGNEAKVKEWEGEQILQRIGVGEKPILLDEKGKSYTSRALADQLEAKLGSSIKCWTWIVGGAYGFSEAVYKAVPERISLSKLTFTHQMVRLIAVEQMYRTITIIYHLPYHHD